MNDETMDKILTEDRFKSLEEDANQILMNRNKLNNRLFEKTKNKSIKRLLQLKTI